MNCTYTCETCGSVGQQFSPGRRRTRCADCVARGFRRECETCGEVFWTKTRRTRFCPQCSHSRPKPKRAPDKTRVCVECGETFLSRRTTAKYCSDTCRSQPQSRLYYQKTPPQILRCHICEREFPSRVSIARYCSDRCRNVKTKLQECGATSADWREAMARGTCAACGEPFNGRTVVDHDHLTGQFRGIIHARCNVGLGQARDDPDCLFVWQLYLLDSRFDLRQLCA